MIKFSCTLPGVVTVPVELLGRGVTSSTEEAVCFEGFSVTAV